MDYKDLMKNIQDKDLLQSGLIGYIEGVSNVCSGSGMNMIKKAIKQYKELRYK